MSTRPQPEDPLEREIEALFSVDHSPEFCARVSDALADAPAPPRSGVGWWMVPVAAIAAAVVLTLRSPAGEPVAPVRPEPAVVALVPAPTTIVSGAPSVVPSAVVERNAAERVAAVPAVTPDAERPPAQEVMTATELHLPEIIVPEDEKRALSVLVSTVQRGRVLTMPTTELADADRPLVLDDVTLATLKIEPLALMAQAEGERR